MAGMAAGGLYVILIAFGLIEPAPAQICMGMGLNLLVSIAVSQPWKRPQTSGSGHMRKTKEEAGRAETAKF